MRVSGQNRLGLINLTMPTAEFGCFPFVRIFVSLTKCDSPRTCWETIRSPILGRNGHCVKTAATERRGRSLRILATRGITDVLSVSCREPALQDRRDGDCTRRLMAETLGAASGR